MSKQDVFLIFAFVMVVLLFIVPQMLCFRIKVLNWLHFNRLAAWHERNFDILVVVLRFILGALILLLFALGAGLIPW